MHCNEVQDLNHAFERDLDVGRLQIAMHDVLFVGGFDPVDQLLNDGHRFVERQRPFEGLTFDVLHHQVIRANVVEVANVRMVQGGDGRSV
jgi:hypothetical protein